MASEFRWALAYLLPTLLHIPIRLSRVHRRGLQQDGLGGVFISLSHPLFAAPQSGAGYNRLTCISLLDITGTNVYRPLLSIRSISVDWLTSQARYVRVGFPRRTLPRFIWFTIPSLSQALLLEDLPSSHSAFQGHAAHTTRWPAMLRPKGSWGACTPHGIIHSSTMLHGADLYTPRVF